MTSRAQCLVLDAECGGDVGVDAPIALCARHLAIAAEWAESEFGVEDVLPSPCRLCGARTGIRYPSGWLCAVCEWRHGDIVDTELPPPRVDIVYYLRFADRVKIGTTANPRQRLAAIMHEEVLGFERGDRSLERHRHEQFADERFGRTEWFELSDRIRAHVDAVTADSSGPWTALARWRSEAAAARV